MVYSQVGYIGWHTYISDDISIFSYFIGKRYNDNSLNKHYVTKRQSYQTYQSNNGNPGPRGSPGNKGEVGIKGVKGDTGLPRPRGDVGD